MKNFVSLGYLLILSVFAFGQEYSFINYSIENGLPQSQVSSFAQDKNNYLWVGTMGGLAKFNGQTFYTYSTKDNLLNNRTTSLWYANDTLFVGHEGGFSIGINEKFKTFRFNESDKNSPTSKVLSFKNKIFAFTNGNGFYILNNKKLQHKSLHSSDKNRIRGALVLDNSLFLATRDGILFSKDGDSFLTLAQTEGLNVSGLTRFDDKKLVLTTFDNEIILYDLSSKTLQTTVLPNTIYGLRNCFVDSKYQIWVPHLEGIVLLSQQLPPTYIDAKSGLNFQNINVVFEDNNQTIWIGSEGKGIFKFAGSHIQKYTFSNLANNELILSTLKHGNNIYYGTYDGEIIIQNELSKATQRVKIANSPIWAVSVAGKDTLLVGSGAGCYQLSVSNKKVTEIPIVEMSKITTILTHNGVNYVGGNFGLCIIKNGKVTKIYPQEKHKTLTIRDVKFNKNEIYLGSDNGLFTLKNDKIERVLDFRLKINSLKFDTQNRLWIGTEEGLYLLENKELKLIYLSGRTSSNIVNFINQDKENLIVGTNDGIYYCNVNAKDWKFYNIGLEEGISNLETNINSSFVDSKDNVYFGTVSGLNVLNIKNLTDNLVLQKPHIVARSISINFSPLVTDNHNYKIERDKTGKITHLTLPFNKNNVLIELDGITLKNYNSLYYQYKVEGLDNAWSSKFKNPQINITNLPHGTYKLLIRGVIDENLYSNTITFGLVIQPPFYLTKWFIIAVSLLVAGLVYFLIQQRVRYEQRKSLQEKNEIKNRLGQLEQESLNASMNRHFIFNALNSIQFYINTQDKRSANKYLSSFAKLIRKNLDSSTENNNLVPLDEELERLKLYLELEKMRFDDKFTYEIENDELFTGDYLVPAMLLQPFVENSILHGILPSDKKGKITISILDFPNHIEIRIKDNGVGIKQSLQNKSITTDAHKSKGMEISSKRIDLLRKLYDKNFELIGPYQTTDENGLISGTTVLIKIPKENM